jgi:hypothetical protein
VLWGNELSHRSIVSQPSHAGKGAACACSSRIGFGNTTLVTNSLDTIVGTTPTILIADRNARVKHLWIGMLSGGEQDAVLRLFALTQSLLVFCRPYYEEYCNMPLFVAGPNR